MEHIGTGFGYHEKALRFSDQWHTFITLNKRGGMNTPMVEQHWHDYYELLYIKKGRCMEIVNGITDPMEEGDIALIKPGAQHATTSLTEQCEILVILFYLPGINYDNAIALQSEYILPFLHSKPHEGCIYSRSYREDKQIIYIAHMIENEFMMKEKGFRIIVQGLLYQILGLLVREDKFEEQSEVPSSQLEIIRNACKYIESNYSGDIRLKTVAAMQGYTSEYFSSLFANVVGRSYKSYCEYVRLSVAEQLLRKNTSISDTAEHVGYQSVSGFTRAFKRVKGYSPQQNYVTELPY